MDRQKQIEEMADIVCRAAIAYIGTEKEHVRGIHGAIAEALVSAGYRKIPENAVALTREEYEKLNNAVDSVQVAVSSFTRLETLYKIKCKELEIAEEKTRKETAEKFAERLKDELCEFLDDNEDLDGKINKGIFLIDVIGVVAKDGEVISLGLIDEIYKEITEGKE